MYPPCPKNHAAANTKQHRVRSRVTPNPRVGGEREQREGRETS